MSLKTDPIIIGLTLAVIVGLNTDWTGSCFGARHWATTMYQTLNDRLSSSESIALVGPAAVRSLTAPSFYSYKQLNDQNAATYYAANLCGGDLNFLWSHSFGGAAAKQVGNAADHMLLEQSGGDPAKAFGPTQPKVVHLSIDPCPNLAVGQYYPWQLADLGEQFRWSAPMSFARTRCLYQRKERIGFLGVCGTPFRDDGQQPLQLPATAGLDPAINLSGWTRCSSTAAAALGMGELDHTGLASDVRVWRLLADECYDRVCDVIRLKRAGVA